jgi:hypothetical protein
VDDCWANYLTKLEGGKKKEKKEKKHSPWLGSAFSSIFSSL